MHFVIYSLERTLYKAKFSGVLLSRTGSLTHVRLPLQREHTYEYVKSKGALKAFFCKPLVNLCKNIHLNYLVSCKCFKHNLLSDAIKNNKLYLIHVWMRDCIMYKCINIQDPRHIASHYKSLDKLLIFKTMYKVDHSPYVGPIPNPQARLTWLLFISNPTHRAELKSLRW